MKNLIYLFLNQEVINVIKELPEFLPEMLSCNGNWKVVEEKLYSIFKRDFIYNKTIFKGEQIDFDRRKIDDDKEEIFWHLITKTDKKTKERLPDFRRAERLPWIKPIVLNDKNDFILFWEDWIKQRSFRIYFWIRLYDYVVILEKDHNRNFYILISAFHVDQHKRRDLWKRYLRSQR